MVLLHAAVCGFVIGGFVLALARGAWQDYEGRPWYQRAAAVVLVVLLALWVLFVYVFLVLPLMDAVTAALQMAIEGSWRVAKGALIP
jgi:hypothetical protein